MGEGVGRFPDGVGLARSVIDGATLGELVGDESAGGNGRNPALLITFGGSVQSGNAP